ncbi:MAG: hypothetical protein J1F39_01270 [Clostridiales bacterium]|nr:hypothetical protein [Clostridiales bacterium]
MIYVLGSIRNDITLEVEKLPKNSDPAVADACSVVIGGKGACQAIAISRISKRDDSDKKHVKLIGRVGNDAVGAMLVDKLNELDVDTEFVQKTNRTTGMTVNCTTDRARRTIIYNGANSSVTKTDVDEALGGATSADTLICQLEVPLYVVMFALSKARSLGMTTILNISNAVELPDDLYYNVDVVVVNRAVAEAVTGIAPSDFRAQMNIVRYFNRRGVQCVAITLGDDGAAVSDGEYVSSHVHSPEVTAVDEAGAGDVFVGALALTYPHVGMYSFEEACGFATRAASLSVTKRGGVENTPRLEEIVALYNREIK